MMVIMWSYVTWICALFVAAVMGLPPLATTEIFTNSSTVQLTVVREEASTIYVIVCPIPEPNTTSSLLTSVLTTTTTFTSAATRRSTPSDDISTDDLPHPVFATALASSPTTSTPIGPHNPPSVPSPVSPIDNLNVTLDAGALDLSEQEEGGHEATVRARGCGWVEVGAGIPTWPNRLVFHTSGGLSLLPGWYDSMTNLTDIRLRAKGGLGNAWACSQLPPTLKTLQMSHTPLDLLDLQECPVSLKGIEIEHSGLTGASLCAPNLTTLNVSWNQVSTALGTEWVGCEGGANGVEELRAQHNLLSKVSTCGWPGLVLLDVRNNQISEMDVSTCVSGGLLTLMAARNRLSTPPELTKTLRHLILNHNHLTSLPAIPHDMLDADFSHNQVSHLGKARFKRARRLQRLNLAHNVISKIHDKDLHGLRDLRELDLSNNRLKDIAASAFHNLQQLKILQLHHNHLSMLDSRLLASFPSTVRANFHNNPWSCTCSLLRDLKMHTACRRSHCRHQIQCLESDSWHNADDLLKQCLHNVQEVNRNTSPSSNRKMSILWSAEDESDEVTNPGHIDNDDDSDDFKASQNKSDMVYGSGEDYYYDYYYYQSGSDEYYGSGIEHFWPQINPHIYKRTLENARLDIFCCNETETTEYVNVYYKTDSPFDIELNFNTSTNEATILDDNLNNHYSDNKVHNIDISIINATEYEVGYTSNISDYETTDTTISTDNISILNNITYEDSTSTKVSVTTVTTSNINYVSIQNNIISGDSDSTEQPVEVKVGKKSEKEVQSLDESFNHRNDGYGVSFVVPILVVLVIVAIISVLTQRLYRRHRRYLHTTCFRCCPIPTPPSSMTHDHLPNKDNDSDTETEL